MKTIMSEYQQNLVVDNIKLAYFIAHKWRKRILYNFIEYEELYSLCLFGLVKAAQTYDIDKNIHFATYSTKIMNNEILMEIRRNRSLSKIPLIIHFKKNESFDMWDLIEEVISKEDALNKWIESEDLKSAIKRITPKEARILELTLYGLSQIEISEITGFTRSYVSQLVRKGIVKLRRELNQK